MPFPRASQALSRFTVLDLTRVRSGPTCVRQLADWGANVIKIDALLEDASGEQPGGPRHGSDFQNLHRNKRAMTLDLKDPNGLKVFRRLAEKADVVVENFRPDVKARLGIDYESLRKINPRIVYGSISGFGQDGPYHKRPGFDQIAQGMGGLMSITGAPGEGPMRGRHPRGGPYGRAVLRHRYSDGALGARRLRRGPVGTDLAACRRRYSCWIFRPRAG
jgi:crotonobetainyl-CoA:carnitine CoA-transferase CaiB-like acyl-CoA transferase